MTLTKSLITVLGLRSHIHKLCYSLKKTNPNWYPRWKLSIWNCTVVYHSAPGMECCCSKLVDRLGLHGFSCIKNAGRFPRHSSINSIPKGHWPPFVSCLSWSLLAWQRIGGLMVWLWTPGTRDLGRSLIWDATIVDTFAQSHYIVSAAKPGSIV